MCKERSVLSVSGSMCSPEIRGTKRSRHSSITELSPPLSTLGAFCFHRHEDTSPALNPLFVKMPLNQETAYKEERQPSHGNKTQLLCLAPTPQAATNSFLQRNIRIIIFWLQNLLPNAEILSASANPRGATPRYITGFLCSLKPCPLSQDKDRGVMLQGNEFCPAPQCAESSNFLNNPIHLRRSKSVGEV